MYYIAREDINYTINYYKEGIEKPFKTENMQGTFGTTVTVPDEKISENKPDGFAYDRTNPIKLLLQIDENKNILNVYYKASMQPYTVNYYLENTTVKLADSKISSARTETKIVEEAIEIEGYSKKAPITEEIIITTGNNEINFYYTPRTDISYTVNYYLENTTTKLAESKIVNGKTFNTTVQEEAKDLSYNGYESIKTTESLLLNKVSGNEINFYYKERTDLSYTVKYYYNGVEDKTKEYTVENQTFGATINEYIDKNEDGWELESATAPITIGVGANVIKVYYTKPIIEVTKSSSKTGIVEPGDEITYTITATNTGKREGKVTITDKIPTGTELKGKITATGLANVTKEQLESGIELTVPVQGGKVTVTFTVEVIGNAGTEISNQATVAGGTTDTTNTVTNKVEKTVGVKEQSETIKGTNVVLVVDTSGSMEGKKLQNAKNEAKKLIDKVIPTDGSDNGGSTISVIEFKSVTEWVVIIPVDKDYAENLGTAKTINQASELKNKVDGLRASGNTPMATALTKAESVLNTFNNNNDNVVIFLSDGDPTDSGYNTVATRIKNSGTKIYTIGFNTSSSADSILASIASKGCNYKAGIDDLANIFEVISSEISGEPVNTTSANGKIELSSKIYVDSKHPIIIKVNGTVNTTITSLPTDAEGKLTFENGKYYLDLTKFNPKDKVTIEYFSN